MPDSETRWSRPMFGQGAAFLFLLGVLMNPSVSADDAANRDPFLERLLQRTSERPQDGSSWRLLGRAQLDRGQLSEALASLQKAVTLSPDSIASWFDLGRVYDKLGQSERAADCFQTAIQLDPQSEYAQKAQAELDRQPEMASTDTGIELAAYDTRAFDGSEFLNQLEDTDPPIRQLIRDRLDLRMDVGLLYNSNVALAPLSRELARGKRESFQLFASPALQLGLFDEGAWRTGPTFRGHFTLNEGSFREFNLKSYRPGWFAEWFLFQGDRMFVPRISYDLTHDEFGGDTLGNRHTLLASLGTFWDDMNASFVFYSVEKTNFRDDGIFSPITSQDGWTNTLGLSHEVLMPYPNLRLVRAAMDVSRADTEGTDYSYNGLSLFLEGVFPVTQTVELTLGGSWGIRDYFDFEFEPSRNEHIWRGTAELRKRLNEHISIAGVFNYDLFDSENPLFAAERYISGVQLEWEY